MLKVVLHVDETEKWPVVIGNAMNLIKDVGRENARLEIIANVNAVAAYNKENELYRQLESLAEYGVNFVACRNSLRSLNMDERLLPAFVRIVPAAVSELVHKQHSGYAYIKP